MHVNYNLTEEPVKMVIVVQICLKTTVPIGTPQELFTVNHSLSKWSLRPYNESDKRQNQQPLFCVKME